MNANTTTTGRDDLFTYIHKGLRLGLFDITVQAGRTDWADPAQVTDLGEHWHGLLTLLRAHGDHEDRHILRLLDSHDPFATEPTADQHRDLARFVAAYLTHMHDEETRVMGRIWACCTDEEIAGARQRFMADMSPQVRALSIEYILPALDGPTRMALEARLRDRQGVASSR